MAREGEWIGIEGRPRGRRGGSLSTRDACSGVVDEVSSAATAGTPRSLEQRTGGGGGGRGGLGSRHCALRPSPHQ